MQAGTTLATVLEIAAEIRKRSEIPAAAVHLPESRCCATGWNALARDAVARGIDGCLLTDLSVEEAEPYIQRDAQQPGSIRCFWPRPPAAERRLELVAQYSTGFVYLVSRTGVTGERATRFG